MIKYWWLIAIIGAIVAVLGFQLLWNPHFGLVGLLRYLAFVLLGTGALMAFVTYKIKQKSGQWIGYVISIVLLVTGILIFANLDLAERTFVKAIGIWAFLMGFYLIVSGVIDKKRKILTILNGGVSITLGFLIYFQPFASDRPHFFVGLYTILLGLFLMALIISAKFFPGRDKSDIHFDEKTQEEESLSSR